MADRSSPARSGVGEVSSRKPSKRRWLRLLSSDFLFKILVGGATGGVTLGVSLFTDQEPVPSITLTLLVSGGSLIVQYLIDVESQLNHLPSDQIEQLELFADAQKDGFDRYGDALKVQAAIDESEETAPDIRRLVFATLALDDGSQPLVRSLRNATLRSVADDFAGLLSTGSIRYEGEEHDRLMFLTRAATSTIDAISVANFDEKQGFDQSFWASDPGTRYVQTLSGVIKRTAGPVTVRHLFAYRDPRILADEEVRAQCRSHHEMDADIRIIHQTVQTRLYQVWIKDVVVIDGQVARPGTPGT